MNTVVKVPHYELLKEALAGTIRPALCALEGIAAAAQPAFVDYIGRIRQHDWFFNENPDLSEDEKLKMLDAESLLSNAANREGSVYLTTFRLYRAMRDHTVQMYKTAHKYGIIPAVD